MKDSLGNIVDARVEKLMDNIDGWELNVIERIGKRIKRIGSMSVGDIKALDNIADVKGDMTEIMRELAKITGKNIREVKKIYADSLEQQGVDNQPLYDYRGKKFVPYAENTYAQAIVNAYAKTTGGEMINVSKSSVIGFYDEQKGFKTLEKAYIEALDKAVITVRSGASDFNTVMRDTIRSFGGSGVRVNYGSGVTRSIEAALRQSILYGSKKAAEEYDEMIGEELGCDGIEIDWHRNPRPSHEFMQGKQYVLGKARKIDGVLFESADEALKALEDYGCRHYKTSIICGFSVPRYDAKELAELNEQYNRKYEIDGKEYTGYEASQMMRKLERETRKINKEKVLAKASGDNVLVKDCNAKIKAYRAKYDKICDATGLTPEYGRMTITRNSEKLFTNLQNGGIIKEGKLVKPTIVLTGHSGTPKISEPNIVIDHKNSENKVDTRSFYGADGYKQKDIHTTDHGNPKQHPYGEHGEHVEDYIWDQEGKLKSKHKRELTDAEREENEDII